ncbi:uncharacterized protein LOC117206787 [Bombus bifarius]|uniref:Uncharacterized protein LOC117206787 n=1 Tax=Bombus bifarius TaxID=103933 RepID=A0A6P8MK74_9HYME|nr:uncharacterized protein LOC117206787 [Bombus bifarius]XP_033302312.1 uncharacterized protein LOC117206787 [Bombus bifarius]
MKVPEVEVENLNLAFSCIRGHMPEGLICEEVTISMDVYQTSWSALCIARDAFPTPEDVNNCIPVKRLSQMSFGKFGIVRRVRIIIQKQPDGDVLYKWQLLIDPLQRRRRAFGVYIQDTLQNYLRSPSGQIHN